MSLFLFFSFIPVSFILILPSVFSLFLSLPPSVLSCSLTLSLSAVP